MTDFLNKICSDVDEANGITDEFDTGSDDNEIENEFEMRTENDSERTGLPLHLPELDLTEEFNLTNICQKASQYESDEQVVIDLGKIIRRIIGKKIFVFKAYCNATKSFVLEFRSVAEIQPELKSIHLSFGAKDTYNVWDSFCKYQSIFCLVGLEFAKVGNPLFFNLFRGWYYARDYATDQSLITTFVY
jgi:hypothetical protein